jgi:hypothetical protein
MAGKASRAEVNTAGAVETQLRGVLAEFSCRLTSDLSPLISVLDREAHAAPVLAMPNFADTICEISRQRLDF